MMQEKRPHQIDSQTVYSGMKSAGTGAPAQNSIGHEVAAPTYPLHHDQRPSIKSKLSNIRDSKVPHGQADRKGKVQTVHNADLTISHTPGTHYIQNDYDGGRMPTVQGHRA